MAPIAAGVAATVAASLAVGMGMAVARAERDRRAGRRRREAERQFALLPGEDAADGLRRIALGQLDLAVALLDSSAGSRPDEHAVHETRKALKRLRALMRVLRGALEQEAFRRENVTLRDTGRRLAGARDAEVMLATLDALRERHPRELSGRGGIADLRSALVSERDRAARRTLEDIALRARVLADLHGIRSRVAAWELGQGSAEALFEPGLELIYRQGRARYRRAASAKRDPGVALHEWRKRVKDLRHAAEMLDRADPRGNGGYAALRARGAKRRPSDAPSQRLGALADAADTLGERLGEEHDLAALAARISSRGPLRPPLKKHTRKTALRLIERRRRKLKRRALREGARLYGRKPRRFLVRARRAYRAASRRGRS